ncbi:uncharacterized protein TNCV_2482801 [Trichonephila clavipes]|uniref:Uncharacterized protein n=1 Tax=Trichonephila clavipes TaxID=2585209 RepID=A0A8X7BBY7_TRICX|nr:uncharacterized protein TNCV_2482801 [Trichonephila clavipes]
MIEDVTFNDSDIMNTLIDSEDGPEEPDYLRVDKMYGGIQLSNKSETHFLSVNANCGKSLKFQKELRSCIAGYRYVHKQLTNRSSPQKRCTYFMVPKK